MANVLVEMSNAMVSAVEKASQSTVLVNARRRMPASGIAIAPDLVLSAAHVIEMEDGIKVVLPDGSEVGAKLGGHDHGSDLAVLKLEKPIAKPAEKASDTKIGELVLALGRPSPEGIEVSLGVISAMGGPVRTPHGSIERYIRTDTTPFPGFSGGPLVDADGRVVGVNTSGFGRGIALTIPSDYAWKVADQLAKSGSVKRGYLGIRSEAVELPEPARQALHRDQETGLLVVGVEHHSPAEAGGLMTGDILVGVAGQPVPDHDALFAHLGSDSVDHSIPVEVVRGGQPAKLDVKIGARP